MTSSTGPMLDRADGALRAVATAIGRAFAALFVPAVAFTVLWQGFLFLRDSDAPKPFIAAIAILWGVGGVALLYVVANWLVGRLPTRWAGRLLPFVFVGRSDSLPYCFFGSKPQYSVSMSLTVWGSAMTP